MESEKHADLCAEFLVQQYTMYTQVDLCAEFLAQQYTMYTRVSELIRFVLVQTLNSSLSEHVFYFLKIMKTRKGNFFLHIYPIRYSK